MSLSEGDEVTIYMDPLTELNREGEATLVRKHVLASVGGKCEYWDVRFGDGMVVGRWIRSDNDKGSPTRPG